MGFHMDALTDRLATRRQRGTSMVEMVFVLPVLLILLFGLADFSLVFHDYLATMNAARAGVREATLADPECKSSVRETKGREAAETLLKNNGIPATSYAMPTFVHSKPSPKGLCAPGYVEIAIHVTSEHRLLAGFFNDPVNFPGIEFTARAGAMSENGF